MYLKFKENLKGGTNQWDVVAEEVEVVDAQYRTSYNCYSSRTDRGKTKYTTEYG